MGRLYSKFTDHQKVDEELCDVNSPKCDRKIVILRLRKHVHMGYPVS